MSPAARGYLEHALDLLEGKALDRFTVNWPKVRVEAFARARDARVPADTHRAIRGAISTIGNRHTTLLEPAVASAAFPAGTAVPRGDLLDGRFARLTIPGFQADQTAAERYVSAGQDVIKRLDAAAPCGWLIDLGTNTGGNMWPMVTVLAPLLGDGRAGSFVGPDGSRIAWSVRGDHVLQGERTMGTNPVRLKTPSPPVAILVSQDTISSGEATLVSFLGLDRVRTFGQPTAGFSTANESFELSDGALLIVTTATMADRTGRRYGKSIAPDERTGDQVAAATAWLARDPACA
ncbi:hypothetical protein BS329_08700 [Amycolatopsis coloradensis]|uniref:Tail specific protease domain-containing protein n=1 Tax=Amycolatopsis coloradensis TaxID=76021 RepID=A0A1R0KZ24_9PSEU|nr:S41 family peptidase [Amycolatopsis coloradensis]OLZ54590.1 hypothetical protein BS329_08700 [Amycolatopsis coloradensis]